MSKNAPKMLILIVVATIFSCNKAKQTTVDSIAGAYVGNLRYHYSDFNLTHGIGVTTVVDTILYADTFFVTKQSDNTSFSIYTYAQYGPHNPFYFRYNEKNSYVSAANNPIQVTFTFHPEKDSISYSYKENWGSGGSEHADHTETFTGKKIK